MAEASLPLPGPGLRRLAAARRVLELLLLGAAPAALAAAFLASAWHHDFGFDARGFLAGGDAVLHGRSPYPTLAGLRAHHGLSNAYVYPPPLALALAPLSLLPLDLAVALLGMVALLAPLAALRVCGVRDWRCYGVTLGSYPVLFGARLGAISGLLALALALAWRWRGSRGTAGCLAAVVAAKVFVAPLALWPAVRGRWRTSLWAALATTLLVAGSWAAIGLAGLRQYPALLELVS